MKKIIHIDMDCFYAAVEMRDNPSLCNVPLAIGGAKEKRGVIATCNYIARKFGIHSAMPTATALRLCPHLTLLKGNIAKYQEVSHQIRAIFARYTNKIEPLSLDEAYLDVSQTALFQGSATLIAQRIRAEIASELKLTASAGVAPIKFVAKVASDINKPNGLYVVTPKELDSFVKSLALGKIPGVGRVTLSKLNQLGLYCGEDVQQFDKDEFIRLFGKFGEVLWQRCHAIDEREVMVERIRKSVGVERTLASNIYTKQECLAVMQSLFAELETRLQQVDPQMRITRQGIKIKFTDFQQTTVEHRQYVYHSKNFNLLLEEALLRQQARGIRLIGISVGLANKEEVNQQLHLGF